MPKQQVTV